MEYFLSRAFQVGLLNPANITWKDFQEAVIGDLSSTPSTPKPTKKGSKQTKLEKVALVGANNITDFHGWTEHIRKDKKDIPTKIKGIVREDRAKCHIILHGLFGT